MGFELDVLGRFSGPRLTCPTGRRKCASPRTGATLVWWADGGLKPALREME